MSFCTNCGKEIIENSKFCAYCGTPATIQAEPVVEAALVVEEPVVAEQPVYEPPKPTATPTFAQNIDEDYLIREEQEFLDMTHRLLRWERKAWSICGKVFFIMGIVFAAIFGFISFIGLIETIDGDPTASFLTGMGFSYALIFGGMFLAIGIIGRKVADKMPIYLDSLYTDFSITNDRSGNVGMLIFTIFFGEVAFVFFLINFIRLKSNGAVINRILARQGKI